jgi:O-antigen/teichoic acid export membrane protein
MALVFAGALGPEIYGQFAFLLAASQVLGMLASLGLSTASVRFLQEFQVRHDLAGSQHFFAVALGTTCLVGLGLGAGLVLGTELGGPVSLSRSETWLVPTLVMGLATTGLLVQTLRALGRLDLGLFLNNLLAPGVTLLTFWVISYLSLPGLERVLWAVISGHLVAFLGGTKGMHGAGVVPRPHTGYSGEVRHWFQVGIPLVAANFSHLLLRRMDVLLLGVLLGAREAGVYAVASRLAQLGNLGFFGLTMLLGPAISRAFVKRDHAFFRASLPRQVRLGFCLSLFFSILLLIGAPVLLPFFGDGFVGARVPLAVLLLGQLVCSLVGPAGCVAAFTGQERAGARYGIVAVLLNLFLDVLWIPRWGGTGAALATSVSMIFWHGMLQQKIRRDLGIDCSVLGWGRMDLFSAKVHRTGNKEAPPSVEGGALEGQES